MVNYLGAMGIAGLASLDGDLLLSSVKNQAERPVRAARLVARAGARREPDLVGRIACLDSPGPCTYYARVGASCVVFVVVDERMTPTTVTERLARAVVRRLEGDDGALRCCASLLHLWRSDGRIGTIRIEPPRNSGVSFVERGRVAPALRAKELIPPRVALLVAVALPARQEEVAQPVAAGRVRVIQVALARRRMGAAVPAVVVEVIAQSKLLGCARRRVDQVRKRAAHQVLHLRQRLSLHCRHSTGVKPLGPWRRVPGRPLLTSGAPPGRSR